MVATEVPMAAACRLPKLRVRFRIASTITSRQRVRSRAPPNARAIITRVMTHVMDWMPPRLSRLSMSLIPVLRL
ncbi:hypothetical protein D3C85_1850120 [compost metagenome]